VVAESHEWLPAYIVLVLLGLLELYLTAPAQTNLVATLSHSATGGASAGEIAQAVTRTFELFAVWAFAGPFVLWGFVATLLTAVAITARGGPAARAATAGAAAAGFSTYFALCVNCALPAELGQLLLSAATRLRDPATFRSPNDFYTVLPFSLAALRPHGSVPEIAFLSYWGLFTLWSLVLLGCGYATIAKMPLVPALLLILGVGLSLALTQVAGGQ